MKRLTLYNIFNLIILCVFISLLVFESITPFFGVSPKHFWFPCLCICIGVSLAIKAIIYKSDSSVWFSITLVLLGTLMFGVYISHMSYNKLWPVLFSIPATSSLIVTIFFKDWLQLKIFTFLTIISISFYLLSFGIISIWWFIPVFIFAFILAFFVCALLPERFYPKKKEK